MKKIILFFSVLILSSTGARSQKSRIGLTAGAVMSNYHSEMDGSITSLNAKPGIMAGFIADLPAGKHFSIQPGMQFVQKGTSDKETYNSITAKIRLNFNILEIPLNFLYNSNSPSGNFFAGAGPCLGIGLSGKQKIDVNGDKETESLGFGKGETDALRSIDLGANVMAGYRFPNDLLIIVNYNLGLNNLAPGGTADGKLMSRYFGLRLGWMLNKARAAK